MIIRYHQLEPSIRDSVKALEKKGHVPYIRYLFLSRTPIKDFDVELTRLGLSVGTMEQYSVYFSHVLYPLIEKHGLARYYKRYSYDREPERLRFAVSFGTNEKARESFCKLVELTETNTFFGPDILKYYGTDKIPLDESGEPIIVIDQDADWTDVLLHEKRHLIDGMIGDGFSPKTISKHLADSYDIALSPLIITHYAKSFLNVKRKGLEDVIEEIQEERRLINEQLKYVRDNTDLFSVGERVTAISTLRNKISVLDEQIKRLQGAHSNASYAQGVVEYSDLREMFADMALRTHRRYKMMDSRTEDAVVDPLSKLVNMMSKATDKMIALDIAMQDNTKKTISEEMIEVILPTLERVDEEERLAREEYVKSFALEDEEENTEILGDDE